ncbi:MAG TPA: hypothetical protein VFF65_12255 [Phycisphaerales bacterium]|nr:hypothetical protein [Phycisphaerales bacterium]
MLLFAAVGALIAAAYGAVHDQVTYAISPEYFTKLKFLQFRWADAGWPPRVFASVVGVLATWWAGLFAGWFMARAGLDRIPRPHRRPAAVRGFTVVLASTIICSAAGAGLGCAAAGGDLSGWDEWRDRLELQDVRAFVLVAWTHSAGYIGALTGLIAAIVSIRCDLRRHPPAPRTPPVEPARNRSAPGAYKGPE